MIYRNKPFSQYISLLIIFLIIGIKFCNANENHLLRVGDVLSILVFNHEELSFNCRVNHKGIIRVPLCKNVIASNKSSTALAEELSLKFQKANIEGAFVTIFVEKYSPRPIYIIGEVKSGGLTLQLPIQENMTALQAISSAGGFSENADKKNISIIRNKKRIAFDATPLLNGIESHDPILKTEDTLIIHKTKAVSIYGSVNNPGAFSLDTSKKTFSLEVISQAGGFLDNADLSRVILTRKSPNKNPETFKINVKALLDGSRSSDILLKPGDSINVMPVDSLYIFGEVKHPGAITIKKGLQLTITRAISMVGGYNSSAKRGNVLLIRGKEILNINLKNVFKNQLELKNDKVVLPGDIIYIQESLW